MSFCGGCQLPIHDKFVLQVLGKQWHQACLRCSDCLQPMDATCFARDGLLLCKNDFVKRYGTRCAGCNEPLEKTDLVRRARDKVFHVHCFQCSVCRRTLDTGEQLYILNEHHFVCEADFAGAGVEMLSPLQPALPSTTTASVGSTPQPASTTPNSSATTRPVSAGSPCGSDAEDENMEGEGLEEGDDKANDDDSSAAKRRGPRTTIKAKQLETLKNAFANTPKPTRHIREQLAQETGLNMRVIQVWFQNRRSKERRMKQLRFGGYRPSRRARGRDEMGGVAPGDMPFPADAAAPYFGGPPPMAFYCGDVYSAPLPPPFPSSDTLHEMDEPRSPTGIPVGLATQLLSPSHLVSSHIMSPPEFDEDPYRPLPTLYATGDMSKPHMAAW